MQQRLRKSVTFPHLLLAAAVLATLSLPHPAAAGVKKSRPVSLPASALTLSAPAAASDDSLLLTAAPAARPAEKAKSDEVAVTPFVGLGPVIAEPPAPERTGNAEIEARSATTSDVTAGVNVNLRSFNLSLGYSVSPGVVSDYVRPLEGKVGGDQESRGVSLGIGIPF